MTRLEVRREFSRVAVPLFLLGCLSLACLTSCQRSAQYRHDSDLADMDVAPGPSRSMKSSLRADMIGQPKKRALVLEFWNDTPIKSDTLGAFAAEELKRGLGMTRRVIVPEDAEDRSDHPGSCRRRPCQCGSAGEEGKSWELL